MINKPIKPNKAGVLIAKKYGAMSKNQLLIELEFLQDCLDFTRSDIDTFIAPQFFEISAAAAMIQGYLDTDKPDLFVVKRALDGLRTLCIAGIEQCDTLADE